MSILYPPIIEGSLPAFTGTAISVPFEHNKAISSDEYNKFALKVKTAQNGKFLFTAFSDNVKDGIVSFSLNSKQLSLLKTSMFYKAQLAYAKDETVGPYSTVGIVKYTTEPAISILGLNYGSANSVSDMIFTGMYTQKGRDTSEKLYSSYFVLKDNKDNILDQSEVKIHTSADDTVEGAYETYNPKVDLQENITYKLQFCTTSRNFIEKKVTYNIISTGGYIPLIQAKLHASQFVNDHDYTTDGIVHVYFEDTSENALATGLYELSRKRDGGQWEVIAKFSLAGNYPSDWSYDDFTVEQGITYQYSVREINESLYSNRIISEEVIADFEDAFLFDGSRQLRIRFNPKIASFKTTLLEQKSNTIGAKYPFIYRNGATSYKEFSISGLISFNIDENELFLKMEDYHQAKGELTRESTLGYDRPERLSKLAKTEPSELLTSERLFKLSVLDWLNDGKTKLFRSATEGNYIVRLMNNSLTPNDTVGRMLHTFNGTAYEMAEFTYPNLRSSNIVTSDIIRLSFTEDSKLLMYKTYDLSKIQNGTNIIRELENITAVEFNDMLPGTKINIAGTKVGGGAGVWVIGSTGTLMLNNQDFGITSISFGEDTPPLTGLITVSYKGEPVNDSAMYDRMYLLERPASQFFGTHGQELLGEDGMTDSKDAIVNLLSSRFAPKPIVTLFSTQPMKGRSNAWYYDKYCTDLADDLQLDTIYEIRGVTEDMTQYPIQPGEVFRRGEGYYADRIIPLSKNIIPFGVRELTEETWADRLATTVILTKTEEGYVAVPEDATFDPDAKYYYNNILYPINTYYNPADGSYITQDELFDEFALKINDEEEVNLYNGSEYELYENTIGEINSIVINSGVVAELRAIINHTIYNSTLDPLGSAWKALLVDKQDVKTWFEEYKSKLAESGAFTVEELIFASSKSEVELLALLASGYKKYCKIVEENVAKYKEERGLDA